MKLPDYWLQLEFDTVIQSGLKIKSSAKSPGECSVRQIDLLRYTVGRLEALEISYAVVGSYASGAWGEPRMTRDIDIVIHLPASKVASICAAFPESEFYVSLTAAHEAVQHVGQFNVIHPASGNKIDFMIADPTGWSTVQLQRCRRIQFDSQTSGYVAAPEDVILGKLIYLREGGSEKHVRDITGIVKIQRESLDFAYLSRMVAEMHVSDIWTSLIERLK
jgi:hypothetical protein